MENLGDLNWRGLVEPDFAWISFREDIEGWWRDFASRIAAAREHNPEFWIRFEELATDCAVRDRRAGVRAVLDLDAERYAKDTRQHVEDLFELLRIEKEFREGAVPEVSHFSPGSPSEQAEGSRAGHWYGLDID
jgi:hypothetical protein